MDGYNIVNLKEFVEVLGEERVKETLSSFRCDKNLDVEEFLKYKAIEFSKQGIASTFLVFTSYKDEQVLIGYYSLANKFWTISNKALSKNLERVIRRYATLPDSKEGGHKVYNLAIPLIAQLGKNFENDYNKLISGDELLKMACDEIVKAQLILVGKLAYVECVDDEHLKEFYEQNGFRYVNKRDLPKSEKGPNDPDYYLQYLIKL